MLIPMHFYRITGKEHRKVVEELAERRAALAEEDAEKASLQETV